MYLDLHRWMYISWLGGCDHLSTAGGACPGCLEKRRSVVVRGGRRPGTDWATFFAVPLLVAIAGMAERRDGNRNIGQLAALLTDRSHSNRAEAKHIPIDVEPTVTQANG